MGSIMEKLLQGTTAPALCFDTAKSFGYFSVLVFVISGVFFAAGAGLMYGAVANQSVSLGVLTLVSLATAWAIPQWVLRRARVGE